MINTKFDRLFKLIMEESENTFDELNKFNIKSEFLDSLQIPLTDERGRAFLKLFNFMLENNENINRSVRILFSNTDYKYEITELNDYYKKILIKHIIEKVFIPDIIKSGNYNYSKIIQPVINAINKGIFTTKGGRLGALERLSENESLILHYNPIAKYFLTLAENDKRSDDSDDLDNSDDSDDSNDSNDSNINSNYTDVDFALYKQGSFNVVHCYLHGELANKSFPNDLRGSCILKNLQSLDQLRNWLSRRAANYCGFYRPIDVYVSQYDPDVKKVRMVRYDFNYFMNDENFEEIINNIVQ